MGDVGWSGDEEKKRQVEMCGRWTCGIGLADDADDA